MSYIGIIIEESLSDRSILSQFSIIKTKIEKVTKRHKTPWLRQWTLHTVEVPDPEADKKARLLSRNLDRKHSHSWYADYMNVDTHYIIFPGKVFKVDRSKPEGYNAVKSYGVKLGIPEYQLDFSFLALSNR